MPSTLLDTLNHVVLKFCAWKPKRQVIFHYSGNRLFAGQEIVQDAFLPGTPKTQDVRGPGCWINLIFVVIFNFLFCIRVQPINNAVTVSGEQWRDSAIHTRVSIPPQTTLPSRLPHNPEQSSLCCPVGLWWSFTLNRAVCTCPSQTP